MSDSAASGDPELYAQAAEVLAHARARDAKIATAESCTGGLIMGRLTDVPGSSDVVDRGFITYTNEAKKALLGVTETALRDYGAVSEQVARAMAMGALVQSDARLAIAVTGIAGPGGGTDEKPVGLVHLAAASRLAGEIPRILHREARFGDLGRAQVRSATIKLAFEMLEELMDQSASSNG